MALLRMLAPTSEQSGGFRPEVAHLLLSPVEETVDVLRLSLVFLRLDLLLLGGAEPLLPCTLRFEVLVHLCEVAECEVLDLRPIEGLIRGHKREMGEVVS